MADGDDKDKKDPHALGDHLLGTNVIHQHEPGMDYDHAVSRGFWEGPGVSPQPEASRDGAARA